MMAMLLPWSTCTIRMGPHFFLLYLSLMFALICTLSVGETTSQFSGVYKPNNKYNSEDFSGSALFAKERLLAKSQTAEDPLNRLIRYKCKGCITFLTRDYLDFGVENPSSTFNLIPPVKPPLKTNIIEHSAKKLKTTAEALKNVSANIVRDHHAGEVLGVLLFESQPYGQVSTEIKGIMLEAAFWSIHRYFPNIIIMVASKDDLNTVKKMKLPALSITVLDGSNVHIAKHAKHHDKSLQLKSFIDLHNRFESEPSWKKFKYVYYSLGDLVTHFRFISSLLGVLDICEERAFILTPHRYQTIPLTHTFPQELQIAWRDYQQHNVTTANIKVQSLSDTGEVALTSARCCDYGRYHFSHCRTWWYTCDQGWGISNYTAWMQFGDTGFVSPAGSAHQGVCNYMDATTILSSSDSSSTGGTDGTRLGSADIIKQAGLTAAAQEERRLLATSSVSVPALPLCPLHEGCTARLPVRIGEFGSGKYDYCDEYPLVQFNPMRKDDLSDPVIQSELLNIRKIRKQTYTDRHLKKEHFAYCGLYYTSETNNAMTNFATCDMYVCAGTKLSMSMCGNDAECDGHTLLRLYDSVNITMQYAESADYCGTCSQVVYRFTQPCQWYTLREGCVGDSQCGGRVVVKEFLE